MEVTPEWLRRILKCGFTSDLTLATGDKVIVAVDGTVVRQSSVASTRSRTGLRSRFADHLKPGFNRISIRLPKGILAYRTYLSPDEPLQYPNLGKQGNARWVDSKIGTLTFASKVRGGAWR